MQDFQPTTRSVGYDEVKGLRRKIIQSISWQQSNLASDHPMLYRSLSLEVFRRSMHSLDSALNGPIRSHSRNPGQLQKIEKVTKMFSSNLSKNLMSKSFVQHFTWKLVKYWNSVKFDGLKFSILSRIFNIRCSKILEFRGFWAKITRLWLPVFKYIRGLYINVKDLG